MVAGAILELEKFKKSDRRLTPQREAVLKAFLELCPEHPTAGAIYRSARHYCPTIGLATIYRSLDLFMQMGIIQRLPSLNGTARYEIKKVPHNHFFCLKCGRTYELLNDGQGLKVFQDMKRKGYEVLNISLIVYGYCPDCRT